MLFRCESSFCLSHHLLYTELIEPYAILDYNSSILGLAGRSTLIESSRTLCPRALSTILSKYWKFWEDVFRNASPMYLLIAISI